MKRILILFLILIIVFIYGCGNEETNPEEITGQLIKDDGTEAAEEKKIIEAEKDILTVRLCHDTDNGIVRWVNGSTFGFYDNAQRFEFNDNCLNKNILIEYYCENENPMNRSFICKNGCEDNHCL